MMHISLSPRHLLLSGSMSATLFGGRWTSWESYHLGLFLRLAALHKIAVSVWSVAEVAGRGLHEEMRTGQMDDGAGELVQHGGGRRWHEARPGVVAEKGGCEQRSRPSQCGVAS